MAVDQFIENRGSGAFKALLRTKASDEILDLIFFGTTQQTNPNPIWSRIEDKAKILEAILIANCSWVDENIEKLFRFFLSNDLGDVIVLANSSCVITEECFVPLFESSSTLFTATGKHNVISLQLNSLHSPHSLILHSQCKMIVPV